MNCYQRGDGLTALIDKIDPNRHPKVFLSVLCLRLIFSRYGLMFILCMIWTRR